ncbi:family 14 glycosylhydrolase [Echinimonas agarilytica]|uniref:Beta-amylase n=1 Tax=Echinimonas agarilytica TaxID=1215918 RepID=A0AA41W4D4_9GAMM|nr:family 14 glycosylhydrolase [Echinimonas agarilytica]MCM2678530.1 family 14 glycosylhydrolase [Echinimonas agarilytica]
MTSSFLPLKVWLYAPVDLHRHIHGLTEDRVRKEALSKKFSNARKQGVDALILPISWRVVAPFHPENALQQESWDGYRCLFELMREAGLGIIPEFSFSASGLSNARQINLMPDWFWGKIQSEASDVWPLDSLKYVDSTGRDSHAAPSMWARSLFFPYIEQFISGFVAHFSDFKRNIPHIQIGVGPEGELRYPLIRRHGKVTQLPVFSDLSIGCLERDMIALHGDKQHWYQAWDVAPEAKTQEILDSLRPQFIALYGYSSASEPMQITRALEGFFAWYQGQLLDYGQACVALVEQQFSSDWTHSIGLRIPVTFGARAEDPNQLAQAAFAGIQLDMQPDHPFDFFDALIDRLRQSTQRNLCISITGLEQAKHSRRVTRWLEQAQQQNVAIVAENRNLAALADHPTWDSLIQRVLSQPGLAGWALKDLDSALDKQSAGPFRLRQLAHLKHGGSIEQQSGRKTFRVMGPLHLKVANQKLMLEEENWSEFEEQVQQLRRVGVTAISTDLWWGMIEGRQPKSFDWTYYDRMLEILAANDMQWVPILSFHQAGGNVNDDFMQTIPLWLWGKMLVANDPLESVRDLQYVSESGDSSMEYVSHWADSYVMPYYRRFMQAFCEHYAAHVDLIDEINISLGPAGELRYPSYNAHDWGNYPNRGTLQCYSRLAQQDWKNYIEQKYATVDALNFAFGMQLSSFDDIEMPDADQLFTNKNYLYSAWGREFLYWYQQGLVKHGRNVLECANDVFTEGGMGTVMLGVKVPGIHWEVSDPETPRVAEITAGLIAPHAHMGPHDSGEYASLLEDLIPKKLRDKVALHFTCLEMVNKDYEGYSRAEDLVNWMADAASEVGVTLMGENALAGELYQKQGWRQIRRALERKPGFGGITLLRLQNLFDDHPVPLQELTKLINREQ